jgi:hypothetical protein
MRNNRHNIVAVPCLRDGGRFRAGIEPIRRREIGQPRSEIILTRAGRDRGKARPVLED